MTSINVTTSNWLFWPSSSFDCGINLAEFVAGENGVLLRVLKHGGENLLAQVDHYDGLCAW